MSDFNLSIIMHHYIRDVSAFPYPGIHGLRPKEFEEQVKRISKSYKMVSLDDVAATIRGEQDLPEKCCLLTFDDGFKEHFETVFPILHRHKISGVFFPITVTLEGKMVAAHKIHLLMATIGIKKIAQLFNDFLSGKSKETQKFFFVDDKKKLDEHYRFDDAITVNLKIRLQTLPADLKAEFLDVIFEEYCGKEGEWVKKFYLSSSDILEMSGSNMVIGSHTHNHKHLDKLSSDEAKYELETSKTILEKLINKAIKSISYPYGHFNEGTIAILKELGYDIGLGTEAAVNKNSLNQWALKRLNVQDI